MIRMKYMAAFAAFWAVSANVQAQDTTTDVPVASEQTVYWLDPTETGKDAQILQTYGFWDNWFTGIQIGGLYNWGSNQKETSFIDHLRPSLAANIGKWLSPSVGLRAQLMFGSNRGITNAPYKPFHFQSLGLYGDGLFNITNMWAGYKEDRFFNLIGFLGIGGEQTFGYSKRDWNPNDSRFKTDALSLLGFRVGFQTLFRLSKKVDLSFEVSNNWVDDSYDGVETHKRWDGHVNAFLGLNFHLQNKTDGLYKFAYIKRDLTEFNNLNAELNRLRAETAAELAKAKPDVNSKQVNVLVSFSDNNSNIDELQEVNVFTAVEEMRKLNNQADLFITVLGGKTSNESLFNERANTIKQSLINDYQIPAQRIHIEKDASVVEAMDKAITRVIVYINENGNK